MLRRWFNRSARRNAATPEGQVGSQHGEEAESADDPGGVASSAGDELFGVSPDSTGPAGDGRDEHVPRGADTQPKLEQPVDRHEHGSVSGVGAGTSSAPRDQLAPAGDGTPIVQSDTIAAGTHRPAGVTSDELFVVGRAHDPFEPTAIDRHYRDLPYRPDTVADGWSNTDFTVRAASVRGYGHRRNGEPRQDDVAVIWGGRRVFAAIADGVSACDHSHLGATIAVRYATRWLRDRAPDTLEDTDWLDLAKEAAWAVIEQAAAITGGPPDPEEAERIMATTLVVAVIEAAAEPGAPAKAQIVSIGDSGAWLASTSSLVSVGGGKDLDAAIAPSAVVGLPRVPEQLAPVSVEIPAGAALLIATDGFGDPLGDASGELGNLYRTRLFPPPPALEFAHMLDFSRATFEDDRAMIAVWPQTPDPVAASS